MPNLTLTQANTGKTYKVNPGDVIVIQLKEKIRLLDIGGQLTSRMMQF